MERLSVAHPVRYGAQVSVLTQEVADRIGVKYVSADPLQATKNDLSLLCAVVDSLSIEGMVIYNMPVYVLKNRLDEVIEPHLDDPDIASDVEAIRETVEQKMERAKSFGDSHHVELLLTPHTLSERNVLALPL